MKKEGDALRKFDNSKEFNDKKIMFDKVYDQSRFVVRTSEEKSLIKRENKRQAALDEDDDDFDEHYSFEAY
jgi:hypothetical protein